MMEMVRTAFLHGPIGVLLGVLKSFLGTTRWNGVHNSVPIRGVALNALNKSSAIWQILNIRRMNCFVALI
jgi:hypothetical protein